MELDPEGTGPLRRLPPPICQQKPDVLTSFYGDGDAECFLSGVTPYEEQLIMGLLHTTCSEQVIRNAPKLQPSELRLLARIIEQGLYAFKSVEGVSLVHVAEHLPSKKLRSSAEARPLQSSEVPPATSAGTSSSRKRPAPLDLKPSDNIPTPPASAETDKTINELDQECAKLDAGIRLFEKLGFMNALPLSSGSKRSRTARFRHGLLERHKGRCMLTRSEEQYSLGCDGAHIIPHSLCWITSERIAAYWQLLGLLLGEKIRDLVFSIVGDNPDALENGILLRADVHLDYDQGHVRFVPLSDDALHLLSTNDANTLDIGFVWRGDCLESHRLRSLLPLESKERVFKDTDGFYQYKATGNTRQIISKEIVRTFTNDVDTLPLPSELLMHVNCRIWDLVVRAGLATSFIRIEAKITKYIKLSRVKKTRKPSGNLSGRSWNDPDDGDDDGSSKGEPRSHWQGKITGGPGNIGGSSGTGSNMPESIDPGSYAGEGQSRRQHADDGGGEEMHHPEDDAEMEIRDEGDLSFATESSEDSKATGSSDGKDSGVGKSTESLKKEGQVVADHSNLSEVLHGLEVLSQDCSAQSITKNESQYDIRTQLDEPDDRPEENEKEFPGDDIYDDYIDEKSLIEEEMRDVMDRYDEVNTGKTIFQEWQEKRGKTVRDVEAYVEASEAAGP